MLPALLLSGCAGLPQGGAARDGDDRQALQALQLARNLRDGGHLAAAADIYAGLDARGRLDADRLLEYASVAAAVAEARHSVALFERVRLAFAGRKLPPEQQRLLCQGLGRGYLAQHKGAEALEAFGCALAASPDDRDARNGLALAQLQTGRLDAARQAFEQQLQRQPDDVRARNNLALCRLLQGDAGAAVSLLQAAGNPAPESLRLNLALAQILAGDREGAARGLDAWLDAPRRQAVMAAFEQLGRRVAAGETLDYGLLQASMPPLTLTTLTTQEQPG